MYLDNISISVSEKRQIDVDKGDLSLTQSERDQLLRSGFYTYFIADRPITAMMRDVGQATLRAPGISANEFDTVIVATDTHWDLSPYSHAVSQGPVDQTFRNSVIAMLCSLGLSHVKLIGIGLGACNSIGPAFITAKALLTSGAAERILVFAGDAKSREGSRRNHSGKSVYSDRFCCFTLATTPGMIKINTCVQGQDLTLTEESFVGEDLARSSKIMMCMRRLAARFDRESAVALKDHDMVIAAALDWETVRWTCSLLGVERKLYREHVASCAHAYGIDGIVALDWLKRHGQLSSPRRVLLINSSVESWSIIGTETLSDRYV